MGARLTPTGMPARASAHRLQARRGRAGARLEPPAQRVVQGGERDGHRGGVRAREVREQVGVAHHQRVLGDHRHGIAQLSQDRQAGAGELERALDGLVAVGHPAGGDDPRPPGRLRQLGAQEPRRIGFDQDARLEVHSSRPAEEFVARSRIAIDAAVLAAAVGVEAGVEAEVGTVVVREDGARAVGEEARGGPGRGRTVIIARAVRIVVAGEPQRLEAVADIAGGAASMHAVREPLVERRRARRRRWPGHAWHLRLRGRRVNTVLLRTFPSGVARSRARRCRVRQSADAPDIARERTVLPSARRHDRRV